MIHQLNADVTRLREELVKLSQTRAQTESEKKAIDNTLNANLLKRQDELKSLLESPLTEDTSEQLERSKKELELQSEALQDNEKKLQGFLFYFILFYFILFYFILFYFIY